MDGILSKVIFSPLNNQYLYIYRSFLMGMVNEVSFNKYRHAMQVRGELEDLMFNNDVISYMDLKYNSIFDKTMFIDDWSILYDECTAIIFEAFDKAKRFDELKFILDYTK